MNTETLSPEERAKHLSERLRHIVKNPPFGGFLAVPPESLKSIYFSPGPLYDLQAEEEVGEAAAEAFHAAGFGPGDIVLNTSYRLVPSTRTPR